MLGVTAAGDGLEGDVSAGAPDSRVKAVVNYFGPTDLAAKDIPARSQAAGQRLPGRHARRETGRRGQGVSALVYFQGQCAGAHIPGNEGSARPLYPGDQARRCDERSRCPGRVELLIGADHGWGGPEMDRTIGETFLFLDRHLKPAAAEKKP